MLEHEPIQVDESPDAAATAANATAAAAAPEPRGFRAIDGVTACVALLIALAGGGLYAMHVRTSAGAARIAAITASKTDVDTVLAGGRESIAALSRSVKATHDLVARLTHHPDDTGEDHVQLASAVMKADGTPGARDPFVLKGVETPVADAPASPTGPSEADRESQRANALAAARQLQVQSIIHGSSRGACLINGRLYFEGQAIDDHFTVQSISSDSVIVRSGDFRFELRLKK